VDANSTRGQTAYCPAGMKAVGGGVLMSGSSLETEIISSVPYDGPNADNDTRPDDSWFGGGSAGPTNETLTTHVICATSGRIRYVVAKKELRSGKAGAAKATCPSGTNAISGGVDAWDITFSSDAVLTRSVPVGKEQWAGSAYNGSTQKLNLKVWAVCADVKTRKQYTYNGTPVFLNNTQDHLETNACSNDKYSVTGLGAEVIGTPFGTEIASLIPTDLDADTARDDGTKAWFNNQSGAPQRMRVTAVCAKI
jgi:hypothetical protein